MQSFSAFCHVHGGKLCAGITGNHAQGVIFSGLTNITGDNTSGVIIGGLLNISGENSSGVHLAGLANIAGESFNGITTYDNTTGVVSCYIGEPRENDTLCMISCDTD